MCVRKSEVRATHEPPHLVGADVRRLILMRSAECRMRNDEVRTCRFKAPMRVRRKSQVRALHEPDLRELVSVARRKLKRDSSQIQNDRRLGQRAEKKGNLRSVLNLRGKIWS